MFSYLNTQHFKPLHMHVDFTGNYLQKNSGVGCNHCHSHQRVCWSYSDPRHSFQQCWFKALLIIEILWFVFRDYTTVREMHYQNKICPHFIFLGRNCFHCFKFTLSLPFNSSQPASVAIWNVPLLVGSFSPSHPVSSKYILCISLHFKFWMVAVNNYSLIRGIHCVTSETVTTKIKHVVPPFPFGKTINTQHIYITPMKAVQFCVAL